MTFRRPTGDASARKSDADRHAEPGGVVYTSRMLEGRVGSPQDLAPLVASAKLRNAAATNELLLRSAPLARAMVRGFFGTDEDRQDVVQEVLVEVWKSLPRLKDPSAYLGWLAKVCASKALSRIRKLRRRQRRLTREPEFVMEGLPDESATDALLELMWKEQAARVEQAVMELPEKYREVLMLNLLQGARPEEIARQLNQSPGTVRSHLCRGLKLLRNKLDQTE